MTPQVQLKAVSPLMGTTFEPPNYATAGAAGLDLRACLEAPLLLSPGQSLRIPTGMAMHMQDPNMAALLLPRSGLGHNKGIVLGNLVGLIDADYQGEIMISCWNRSTEAYTIQPGERIAQLLFVPVLRPEFAWVTDFVASERGEGGFGSTGTR